MVYYSDFFPDRGDSSALTTFSANLVTTRTSMTDASTAISTAVTGMDTAAWGGEAGDAWRARGASATPPLDALAGQLSAVEAAVTVYIGAVDGIVTRTAGPRGRVAAAENELRMLYWSSTYSGSPAYGGIPFCGDDPEMIERSRDLARAGAESQLEEAREDLRELKRERDTAAGVLCAALEAGAPANWPALRSALLAAGITTADQLTADGIASALEELSRKIANGQHDPADVEHLTTILGEYGDDSVVMSRFFLGLGGTDTVSLIDRIGDDVITDGADPVLALALAQALRSGLSVASSAWVLPSTAEKFAQEMLDGASSGVGGRVAAIGFLFSDVDDSPLSESLTVAMADLIDAHERNPFGVNSGAWSDTSPLSGGATLASLEDENGFTRVNDLGARVMQTLGLYPDAALDWLTAAGDDVDGSGSLGDGRVAYWFGERDSSAWSTGDGFEGVSALWEGAMRADGGLLAGGDDHDKMVRIATLSTSVLAELADNPAFTPEGMSARGTVALAQAVGLIFPQIDLYPMTADDADQFSGPYRADGYVWGVHPVPTVFVTDSILADILANAASSDVGRLQLDQALVAYRETLLGIASSPDSPITADSALSRIVQFAGAIEGAMQGSEIIIATDLDDSIRDLVDMATSFVPIGGPYIVGVGGDILLGEVAGAATDAWWANNLDSTVEQFELDTPERMAAFRDMLAERIEVLVEAGVMTQPDDLYIDTLVDLYNGSVVEHKALAVEAQP